MSGIELASVGWIWKYFHKDIIKLSSDKFKESWQQRLFKHAAKEYAEAIKRRYNVVQIWRMAEPLALNNIYTRVNVLSKPSTFIQKAKEHLELMYLLEASYGNIKEEGKDALEAVRENERLFILGKPGAGKTTFLKYLMLQAAEKTLNCIPIFVPLKEFSESGKTLIEFITQQFEICNFPDARVFIETILNNGESFILDEDALSKLRPHLSSDVIDKLQFLAHRRLLWK